MKMKMKKILTKEEIVTVKFVSNGKIIGNITDGPE